MHFIMHGKIVYKIVFLIKTAKMATKNIQLIKDEVNMELFIGEVKLHSCILRLNNISYFVCKFVKFGFSCTSENKVIKLPLVSLSSM